MIAFSISEAARTEIREIIRTSGRKDSVVALIDDATLDLTDDVKGALLKGIAEGKLDEVKPLVENEFNESTAASRLLVAAYEREECNPAQLCEIDGIPFAMPIALREALRDYTLTYVNGEFLLESPDETVANLRSVRTLAAWFK